jgi:O-antigen ligase/polysaccharide polymerase Wzy-like membrane protein
VARQALERLERTLRGSPGALPGAFALLVMGVWAAKDGGFDPTVWLPGTLLLAATLVVFALTAPGRFAAPSAVIVALVALGAFTAWNYASIAWAESRSDAWSGANKTLAYLLVYAIFVLRPWRAPVAAALVGCFVVGVAVVGLRGYLSATVADDPLRSFIAGRLAAPIAYSNANCALFMAAFWPALWLSSRREAHPLARAALLGSAGVLAELALMCQSRGSLVAVPITLAVYLALVPGRLRSIVVLVPVAAAVAISARPVLDVYEAVVSGESVRATLVDARTAILWSAAALIAVGALLGLVDRLVVFPRVVTRLAGAVAIVALLAGVVGGSAALADRYGDPVDRAGDWWRSFKSGQYVYEPGTPHLTSGLGSGRYDIWRVAAKSFEDHPVVGAGADNFLTDYLRERHRLDDPLYPHSLELRLLSQVGVIGTLLALVFLVAALVPAAVTRVRGSPFEKGLAAALIVSVLYWVIHGSIDWFWEIPALAAPAFAFLGIAGRLESDTTEHADPPGRRAWWPAALLAVCVAVACVSLVVPWIVARDIDAAASGWSADPTAAFDRLDRARSLDPWSDQPDVYAAVIAAQLRRSALQRRYLQHALERNPANWYALVELGAMDGRSGHTRAALTWLRRATIVNPLEPIIRYVTAEVRAGRAVSQQRLDKLMVDRVDLLLGERQG